MSEAQTMERPQTAEAPQEAKSRGEVAVFQPPRLPWSPSIEERFGVDRAGWKALTEAVWPLAKTSDSVALALAYCKARKLDPFKKVVHIVPMWDNATRQMRDTVWPGIAELRTTAFRTGDYAGHDAATFGPDKTEKVGNVEITFPEWCQITVRRIVKGQVCAFPGPRVYWRETYAQTKRDDPTPNSMWQKRPHGQIEKCAEAAALRSAFPEELGGEYAAEEMEGKIVEHDARAHDTEPATASTQASGRTAKDQLAGFAGDAPGAAKSKVIDAEVEPVGPEKGAARFELRDEANRVEVTCDINQWAKELLAAATDPAKGQAYLRNNRAVFVAQHLEIDKEVVDRLARLYGTLPDEPKSAETTKAAQGQREGAAGDKAAAAPQAPAAAAPDKTKPIALPKKDGKVQVGEYVRLINTEIGEAPTAGAVDAIVKREEPNLKKFADSVVSSIKLRASQRKRELAQGAEEKPAEPPKADTDTPPAADGPLWRYVTTKGEEKLYGSLDEMVAGLTKLISKGSAELVKAALERNKPALADIRQRAGEDAALAILTVFHDRIKAAEAEDDL